MADITERIPGYTYGTADVAVSPVPLSVLKELLISLGFTEEDRRYLQMAGDVLAEQTRQIVDHWRNGIIVSIPNLARHSRTLDGKPLPNYTINSGLRFAQWILDTCYRPYDQDWLNYQHEIALRHTTAKKNVVDAVASTPYVPLRDVITFLAVMNQTLKPYLAAKGNSAEEVDKMHAAWCKSVQLQIALWARAYTDTTPSEW